MHLSVLEILLGDPLPSIRGHDRAKCSAFQANGEQVGIRQASHTLHNRRKHRCCQADEVRRHPRRIPVHSRFPDRCQEGPLLRNPILYRFLHHGWRFLRGFRYHNFPGDSLVLQIVNMLSFVTKWKSGSSGWLFYRKKYEC